MSASDSFKAQLELCALQSAALTALLHFAVNLSVHFASFAVSGGRPFAYPLANTALATNLLTFRLRDPCVALRLGERASSCSHHEEHRQGNRQSAHLSILPFLF